MNLPRLFLVVLALLAAFPTIASEPPAAVAIELPSEVGPFRQFGTKVYDDPLAGYSVRFDTDDGVDKIDVYVYPIHPQLTAAAHDERVEAYMAEALHAIEAAVQQGLYESASPPRVAELRGDGDRVRILTAMHVIGVEGEMRSSWTWVSELDGQVVKVRATLNDERSRTNAAGIQEAARTLFAVAMSRVHDALRAPGSPAGSSAAGSDGADSEGGGDQ